MYFKQFTSSISAFIKSFGLFFKYGLWWYLIFPLIFTIFLSAIASTYTDMFSAYLEAKTNSIFQEYLSTENTVLSYLNRAVVWLIKLTLKLSLAIAMLFYAKYVVLLLLSPVLSMLSFSFAKKHFLSDEPNSVSLFIKQIFRALIVIIRNIFLQSILMIISFSLVYIFPPLIIIQPILFTVIALYFYGYTFIDFVLERKNLSPKATDIYVFKNFGVAIGIGLCFSILFKIPFIGIIFAPILATVAATFICEKSAEKFAVLN